MTRLVLDASVTLGWFFQENESALVERVADILAGNTDAVVPAIWRFEVRNVLVTAIRRKRTTEYQARNFLNEIIHAELEIDDGINEAETFDLALKHRLTFYEACYLELAIRTRNPLATLDRALIAAAKAENVRLIGAP